MRVLGPSLPTTEQPQPYLRHTGSPNSPGNVRPALGNAGWTHNGPWSQSARQDSFTVFTVFYWVVAGAAGTFMLDF